MDKDKLLIMGILIAFGLVFSFAPAEAIKSQGTPLLETNSKKVCGDELCSELNQMKNQEMIDIQFDDSMVFQQSVPNQRISSVIVPLISQMQSPIAMQLILTKPSYQLANGITAFQQFDPIGLVMEKQEMTIISSFKTKKFDLKNPIDLKLGVPKISNEFTNLPLKIKDHPTITPKINFDSKALSLNLEKFSSKNIILGKEINKDPKFLDMVEKFKKKKIDIEKSD